MGAWAEKVEVNDEVRGAVDRAFEQVEAGRVALLHVVVDQDHATPEGSEEA